MDECSPGQGAGKGLGAPAGLEVAAGAVAVPVPCGAEGRTAAKALLGGTGTATSPAVRFPTWLESGCEEEGWSRNRSRLFFPLGSGAGREIIKPARSSRCPFAPGRSRQPGRVASPRGSQRAGPGAASRDRAPLGAVSGRERAACAALAPVLRPWK